MKIRYTLILEKFNKYLINRYYAESTKRSYMKYVTDFLNEIGKSPTDITKKEVELYLEYYNYSSRSQQNQVINAVKLFAGKTLGLAITKLRITRPRKTRYLPVVLNMHEINQVIDSIKNIKHKAIIATIYYFGLRISELSNLCLSDFDNTTKLLHIKDSKGFKDRIVPINPKWVKIIKPYYYMYKPMGLLFEGENGKYSPSSVRKILDRAVSSCNINKKVCVHSLRHSYATHLLNSGNNIRQVQEILGHARLKTTELYTHISAENLQNICHV